MSGCSCFCSSWYPACSVSGSKSKQFCFWFHCSFVDGDRLVIKKQDLDKACKDKSHKYDDEFAIEMRFRPLPHASAP